MKDAHIHFDKQEYSLELIENMVRVAQSRGVDELNLLDHTHKFRDFDWMYEYTRHEPDTYAHYQKLQKYDLQEYWDFIARVREHSWPIQLHFGLEVCYFPQAEARLRRQLQAYPYDFLIGSVHHIDGFAFDFHREDWDGRDVDQLYRRYFAIMDSLIASGLFDHLAHPDSIKIFGHYPGFDLAPYYKNAAEGLKKAGMTTENNSGFARYGFTNIGLDIPFLRALQEAGVTVFCSSDAHRYTDIGGHFDELPK